MARLLRTNGVFDGKRCHILKYMYPLSFKAGTSTKSVLYVCISHYFPVMEFIKACYNGYPFLPFFFFGCLMQINGLSAFTI